MMFTLRFQGAPYDFDINANLFMEWLDENRPELVYQTSEGGYYVSNADELASGGFRDQSAWLYDERRPGNERLQDVRILYLPPGALDDKEKPYWECQVRARSLPRGQSELIVRAVDDENWAKVKPVWELFLKHMKARGFIEDPSKGREPGAIFSKDGHPKHPTATLRRESDWPKVKKLFDEGKTQEEISSLLHISRYRVRMAITYGGRGRG